jgi:DNA-binding MarR family transcriptional regulator
MSAGGLNENAREPGRNERSGLEARLYGLARTALGVDLKLLRAAAGLRGALARFAGPHAGLGTPRFLVVRALYLADGRLSLGELARAINVTSTNVTSLIDGLEKTGWVRRTNNPGDRRVVFAELTADGRARCEELVPRVATQVGDLLSEFTDEDLGMLTDLLNRLTAAFEAAFSGATQTAE